MKLQQHRQALTYQDEVFYPMLQIVLKRYKRLPLYYYAVFNAQ